LKRNNLAVQGSLAFGRPEGDLLDARSTLRHRDRIHKLTAATAMNRSELVERLAETNPHLTERDAAIIVRTVFGEITAALLRGDRVELRGFGMFAVKKRDARSARNPRTGKRVAVSEKHVPFFKTGKQLRDRLQTGHRGDADGRKRNAPTYG